MQTTRFGRSAAIREELTASRVKRSGFMVERVE
jgi:hypothetical protein